MLDVKPLQIKKQPYRTTYEHPDAIQNLTDTMLTLLPTMPRNYVVVCIGTDRSTGDSLGPLIGSFLAAKSLKHLSVYGSLHEPVHALNLDDHIKLIEKRYRNPFIIAIDACLGRKDAVGDIILDVGTIKPGSALKKSLPAIGDLHLLGVVNVSGFMEMNVLQSTRLAVVMDLAETMASAIALVDNELMTNMKLPAVLKKRSTMSRLNSYGTSQQNSNH